MANEYNKNVKAPEWFSNGFNLENGMEQLKKFFSNVTVFHHDNNLIVTDWRAIYDYMCSLPGGLKKLYWNILCFVRIDYGCGNERPMGQIGKVDGQIIKYK